nr:uncharacterized protein c3d6.13c [Quercus suber]
MRPSSFLLRLLATPLVSTAFANPTEHSEHTSLSKRTEAQAQTATVFNGKSVPPMLRLKSASIDEDIKDGYWMIEFFSPYCHHCTMFAPTLQTAYEFYYTSDTPPPEKGTSKTNEDKTTFTQFYDFKFAQVDCVANGDVCSTMKIMSYPTTVVFKDGKLVKQVVGARSMEQLSDFIEGVLESAQPGSRPTKDQLKLPKAGDHQADDVLIPDALLKATVNVVAPSVAKPTVASSKKIDVVHETPNQLGKSTELTAENFQRLVTMTHDPWFVKFYAPWCHHCQDMAPNWQGMARQMKGQLNIGEVNCEVEKRLCKDVKVRSYPTIVFFRGGERIEYQGLRGLGDLVHFANKAVAVGDGVLDVDASQFEELEKKEEVLFLYLYDHATTGEDFLALERLVMSLIGHAKLVKTNDPALYDRFKISTWPRLLVSRDGKPTYYNALAPRDMRDFRRVLNWMQSVWLPIVPELTATNAEEIMNGRLVVLGILSRDRPEEFLVAKREIKNAALEWIDKQTQAFKLERQELRDAKQLRIEEAEDRNDQRGLRAAKSIRINMDEIERKEVGFAWVDGIFWERWIRTTFGISVLSDNERVVMYDYDNHRYWDVTMTGNPIVPSRTSILETLPRAIANPPKIASKSTTTTLGHVWWVAKGQLFEHPIVSISVSIAILLGIVILARRHTKVGQLGAGYFRVGEKSGTMDGLLGGNTNGGGQGKVD